MAKSFAAEVVETSQTTGTGTYNLAGIPAGSAYRTFRQEFSNGETKVCYVVRNAGNTKWEINRFGTLTYGTPDTLGRQVVKSTNSDAAVSWISGDLPLTVYIPSNDEALELAITMGLGTSRPSILRYGLWADQDGVASGYDQINAYDGNSDHAVGVFNRTAHKATLYGLPPGYLYGLTLSRSSAAVLGIAAGIAMDSTNVVGIQLASAFTKSTAGAWTSGTGNNGMGNSLTIANDTTYHVFEILNAGVADVYFDTSVSAANKPTNTTHFRRIGSFRTNGSAQIIDFVQDGDEFRLVNSVADGGATNPGISAVTKTLSALPTGIRVKAIVTARLSAGADAANAVGLLSDLSVADQAPGTTFFNVGVFAALNSAGGSSLGGAGELYIWTNTSAQIRSRINTSGATTNIAIQMLGWIDRRGRDA